MFRIIAYVAIAIVNSCIYLVPYFGMVRDFLPSSSYAASEKLNDVSYSFAAITQMPGKGKSLSICSNACNVCSIHLGVTVFQDSVAISYSNDTYLMSLTTKLQLASTPDPNKFSSPEKKINSLLKKKNSANICIYRAEGTNKSRLFDTTLDILNNKEKNSLQEYEEFISSSYQNSKSDTPG
uniref:Uncharacterized protein n=1 Tax=Glossina brevipalpis TaxID=37001 RepID=A0A1A9WZH3_9MUSC